jgi:hypothetical protein
MALVAAAVDAAKRRVGVGVMEDLKRLVRFDLDLEGVAGPRVATATMTLIVGLDPWDVKHVPPAPEGR